MTSYHRFWPFYDRVMDDPGPRADRVAGWIERFRPEATSLLELGCGTGSMLARLEHVPHRTGLDHSAGMLAVAAEKVPGARLVEGDMRSFALGERFDVVICIFDTLNHLLAFEEWCSLFDAVHDHLADGGLFVFDVNTVGELRRLGEEPPWVDDFDGGVAVIDVAFAGDGAAGDGAAGGVSRWDVRIFEEVGPSRYELHREQIDELGVPLAAVKAALADRFDLLAEENEEGGPPTDESIKGHFAYRRRD